MNNTSKVPIKLTDGQSWGECPDDHPIAQRLWRMFEKVDTKTMLMLRLYTELQSAEGYAGIDLANPIRENLNEVDVGDDLELQWLQGLCQGLYLLNCHG